MGVFARGSRLSYGSRRWVGKKLANLPSCKVPHGCRGHQNGELDIYIYVLYINIYIYSNNGDWRCGNDCFKGQIIKILLISILISIRLIHDKHLNYDDR